MAFRGAHASACGAHERAVKKPLRPYQTCIIPTMSALAKLGLGSSRSTSETASPRTSAPSAMSKLGLSGGSKAPAVVAGPSSTSSSSGGLLEVIDSMLRSDCTVSGGPQLATMGFLHKKSGGHTGGSKGLMGSMKGALRSDKWDKRYFVLPADSSTLSYYKSEDDFVAGKTPQGSVDIPGATVFLKKVSKARRASGEASTYRFTVRASERELKLRADSEDAYLMWVEGLRPRIALFRELAAADDGDDDGDNGDDGDDDGDDGPEAGGERGTSGAGKGRSTSSISSRARQATTAALGSTGAAKEGWLLKKSGGHRGSLSSRAKALGGNYGSWERRYFVLLVDSSVLSYWESPAEFLAARPALGSVECAGAQVFLKEVEQHGQGVHRFTIRSKERDLKLKAESEAEYASWMASIASYAQQVEPEAASKVGAGREGSDGEAEHVELS